MIHLVSACTFGFGAVVLAALWSSREATRGRLKLAVAWFGLYLLSQLAVSVITMVVLFALVASEVLVSRNVLMFVIISATPTLGASLLFVASELRMWRHLRKHGEAYYPFISRRLQQRLLTAGRA